MARRKIHGFSILLSKYPEKIPEQNGVNRFKTKNMKGYREKKMKKRMLGNSLEVSEIGLGCMD